MTHRKIEISQRAPNNFQSPTGNSSNYLLSHVHERIIKVIILSHSAAQKGTLMNFEYLDRFAQMKSLYEFCREAEDFALFKPETSALAARKAVEYIVKTVCAEGSLDIAPTATVYDMLRSPYFLSRFPERKFIDCLHSIRKLGNSAAHGDPLTSETALESLQHLHYIVGEYSVSLGLIAYYPEFKKPAVNQAHKIIQPPTDKNEFLPVAQQYFARSVNGYRVTEFAFACEYPAGSYHVHFYPAEVIIEFFLQEKASACLRYKNGVSLLPLTVSDNPNGRTRNAAMQELVHNGYIDKFDAPNRLSKKEMVPAVAAYTNGRILPGKRNDPCIITTEDGRQIECICMASSLNI